MLQTQKSIIFQFGIEGHAQLAKACQDEFRVPIAGIVLTQAMERWLARCEIYQPDRLYSFPAFYSENIARVAKLPLDEVRSRISSYESRWNIPSIATYVYFDRYFRRELNYPKALRLALVFMEFADHILSHEDPLWVRGNLVNFFGLVLQQACLARGIPSLKPRAACISGRIEFMDETSNGGLRGWWSLYQRLCRGEEGVPKEVVEEARDWLKMFQDRPARPKYAEIASNVQFRLGRFARQMLHSVSVRFDKNYWDELLNCRLDRQLYFRERPGRAFLVEFLGYQLRAMWQRRAAWFREQPDLDEPFVYLPLQYTPEISTLTHGLRWEDQANLVSNLAKYLPSGLRLYVKEHTSMVGHRSGAFYRRIQEHYNVTLVSPNVGTFDLIRKARAVATVTSTAGWEAFVLGKPVLVFGEVFFQEFPNVLKLGIDDDTPQKIRAYIEGFERDESAIENAVIAYFGATSAGETGDIGNDIEPDQADTNAAAFARSVRFQLSEFPLHVLSGVSRVIRRDMTAA